MTRVLIAPRENGEVVKKTKTAGAGLPMGFVMGLFGISGGVIGVPYQRFLLKVQQKSGDNP